MGNFRKTLFALGFAALAITAMLVAGYMIFRPTPAETVTSTAILERISDNYFVVTKSAIVDEEVEITVDKGSAWSNFFWGQTITARGKVRIDIGVDLSDITEDDISIDHKNKTVSIAVPQSEILDASQYGNIEVGNKQGLLKTLLDSDPNEDHNRAVTQLITEARAAISGDTELFAEARLDSMKLLELIVKSFGYELLRSGDNPDEV
jgi:hypothetical protein